MFIQFATISIPAYVWPHSDLVFWGTIDTATLRLRRLDPYLGKRKR